MSIVTFGANARANNAFALKNTTNASLVLGLLRGPIAANSYKFFTFAQFDAALRGNNLRNSNLYSLDMDGHSPYLDDVSELAKNLANGTLVAYTANFSASGFNLGSALASATYGDGSVTFS